jgi:ribose transport system substrate-binding protein
MKRWIALPMAALLLLALVAGCGSSGSSGSSSSSSVTTSEPKEEIEPAASKGGGSSDTKVSYISPVASAPGQQQVNLGIEHAAKELGWSESVLDSNLSVEKQVSNIEIAINSGDDAIASWTLDPNAAAGAYEAAQAKGIPVIGMNSEGPGLTSTVWWETELCEPGGPQAVSAEKIAELHPHAKVIMVADHIAPSETELSTCFMKEAKKAGLDVLVEGVTEEGMEAPAQKLFEPLLTKYPEVEAVWAFNDESAEGASNALIASGKTIATIENPEGVIVTGINGDAAAIEAIEEGRMSWTWDPDNVATGYAGVKAMKEALEGGKPEKMVVESELVDSETVGEYVAPEQRTFKLEDLPIKQK